MKKAKRIVGALDPLPLILSVKDGKLYAKGGALKYINEWITRCKIPNETPLNIVWQSSMNELIAAAKDFLFCDFCGKCQNEVFKMIAANNTAVCNECVDICNEILLKDEKEKQ